MSLLRRAAVAWMQLVGTEYIIVAGRKGKLHQIRLQFAYGDFPHIAGMQYARDVALNLNPNEYYGEKLVPVLISGKLDGKRIETSRNWPKIRGRLSAIINLQKTLETHFELAQFDPKKVKTNSKIDADYVLRNARTGEVYFVFIDEDAEHRQYCKSAFERTGVDFMLNQPLLTILECRKCTQQETVILYRHPNYTT